MRADTHIHTKNFSADAIMDFDSLVNHARQNPNDFFCISEHFDYDYPNQENQLIFDPNVYFGFYNEQKKNYVNIYHTEFPILIGVEYGYMENLALFYDSFAKLYNFDSIISSAHYIEGCDPFFEREIYDNGKRSVYEAYLTTIIHSLENCSGFDIVGHFDYISRYAPYDDKKMNYRDFSDYFDKIFSLCAYKGKALELNTRTSAVLKSEKRPDYFFDSNIIKRYKELGGELISFGSDAHSLDNLFGLYNETIDLIKSEGFKYITYYKNRKAIMLNI